MPLRRTLLLIPVLLLALATPCGAPGGRSNLELFLDEQAGEGGTMPIITSPTTASGTVGTAFTYQITATQSPTSYAAFGLPAGLTVATSTGLISGTPTAGGVSAVTLQATNASGTGTLALTLTISPPPLAAQRYLYWRLDEGSGTTALDTGTCGCPGTLLNAPGRIAGRVGSGALSFNGSTQVVQNTTLVWPAAQPFTIQLWVNAPGGTPNGTFDIGASTDRLGAHIPWSDNVVYFDVGSVRTQVDYTPYVGRWAHVSLVYDGANTRKIYLDGVLKVTNTTVAPPPGPLTGVEVGRYRVGGLTPAWQTGGLDDFRITTTVRTDAEILGDARGRVGHRTIVQ